MREKIQNKQFDAERALYAVKNADIEGCAFQGPADGESALKEARNVALTSTTFSLRYPLWHVEGFSMDNCTMDELTRAAIWYARDGKIHGSKLCGIKAVRECENISISNSEIVSPEFGWKSNNISLEDTTVTAEYLFLDSKGIKLSNVTMNGKYSFQYVENLTIDNSMLNTKDAFWHAKNVTVRNSVVRGEYLGWFSEGLTLESCEIIGTQPLCYCKDLKLINCKMTDADLAFEYSEVDATVDGHIDSVKNPKSGKIVCDSVGEVIFEDAVFECLGRVEIRK